MCLWLSSACAIALCACAADDTSHEPSEPTQPVTDWAAISTAVPLTDIAYVAAHDDYVATGRFAQGKPVLEGQLDDLREVTSLHAEGNVLGAYVWTDGDAVIVSTQFGPYIPVFAERRDGEWNTHWDGIGYLVYPIAATSRSDIYAGAPDRMLHFDGEDVSVTEMTPLDNAHVVPAWNGGEHGLWGVGEGFNDTPAGIYRFVDDHWELDAALEVGEHVRALWGDADGLRFAVSDRGLRTLEGGTWSLSQQGMDLSHIAGDARNDVYAVGAHGTLLHFNGDTWSTIDTGTDEDLSRISIADREILIVTEQGELLRGER